MLLNKRQLLGRGGVLALGATLPLAAQAETPLERAINERVRQMRGEGRLAGDERTA